MFGEDRHSNNIYMWVNKALKENKTLNIVDDQFRTPTYIDDLCKGIFNIIETSSTGIYNISGEKYLSIFDFVCNIARRNGFDLSLIKRSNSSKINQVALSQ